eukprot:Pompholyxophrys_punicea_v1_NODE_592_length_1629_cov_1.628335.p4 type:complete len:106 gc:universal NODE_592_length_1629_cov_1.628335:287-604(+)
MCSFTSCCRVTFEVVNFTIGNPLEEKETIIPLTPLIRLSVNLTSKSTKAPTFSFKIFGAGQNLSNCEVTEKLSVESLAVNMKTSPEILLRRLSFEAFVSAFKENN